MIDNELLIECKKGLGISVSSTNFDGPLLQKILTVKTYMLGAGISEEILNSDLAVGTIVVGVTDIWNIQSGTIKFSPIFYDFATQLAIKSLPDEVV
jgi:hypothetical protein